MTTNDAAERLREEIDAEIPLTPVLRKFMREDLDAALAAERRATVERIRAGMVAALDGFTVSQSKAPCTDPLGGSFLSSEDAAEDILAAMNLDAEAAR